MKFTICIFVTMLYWQQQTGNRQNECNRESNHGYFEKVLRWRFGILRIVGGVSYEAE